VEPLGDAPLGDAQQRLGDDSGVHLRLAVLAFDEGYGVLHHGESSAFYAPGDLHLEAVPLRRDARGIQPREGGGAEDPEAGRDVADARSQRDAGVGVAAPRDELAHEGPVAHGSTGNPPGADHEVGTGARERDHGREVGRIVRAVGIDLDDEVVATLSRDGEAREVGAAEPVFRGAVQHGDGGVGCGRGIHEVARAVRAAVVDDEHVGLGYGGAHSREKARDALDLVVGGNQHQHVSHGEPSVPCASRASAGRTTADRARRHR
jgi:hypothetical protein